MFVEKYDVLQLTEALADPDAQHVELQQALVGASAALGVHEQVVEKGAAPGRQGACQVTPRQEGRARARLPREQFGHHCYYVDYWQP